MGNIIINRTKWLSQRPNSVKFASNILKNLSTECTSWGVLGISIKNRLRKRQRPRQKKRQKLRQRLWQRHKQKLKQRQRLRETPKWRPMQRQERTLRHRPRLRGLLNNSKKSVSNNWSKVNLILYRSLLNLNWYPNSSLYHNRSLFKMILIQDLRNFLYRTRWWEKIWMNMIKRYLNSIWEEWEE